jgi:hypothetical protein
MASRLESLILRASGAAQVTLGRRLASLWGGYGELWRAELVLPAGKSSVIVKHVQPPPGPGDRSHQRKLRSYAVEQAFYQQYAARCVGPPSCRVPRPLGVLAEAGGWLFVLEDLTKSGFARRHSRADPVDIAAGLRWLAGFHARFLGSAPDTLWPTGTYWHLATRPDELPRVPNRALRDAAPHIDRALEDAHFKTLVHGDAKLENVCFADAGDAAALVDFQYVGGGVGVKDVAYFLSSCVPAERCEKRVPDFLDLYFVELQRAVSTAAPSTDFARLEREWRALFPLAWVDYYRFLVGWVEGELAPEPYSELLTEQVLRDLKLD